MGNTMTMRVGRDTETGCAVTVGDRERCGGLYVLGQPRSGKSTLLISLALSDIEKGYGILFIDPHTDAINDLLARIPITRQNDVILLDPTHKEYSFGINLLCCSDPTDPLELDKTCGRVRDIFVKVWGDEKGQLGVWLDKIIRNSVYLLLENPGHTLIEIPLLLDEDTRFRNALLENVRVNTFIKDFWYYEFDRLTKRDKTEQVGPALSRLELFRNTTMIRNIVGQEQSTIDFHEILNGNGTQKIILLRMPTQLRSDVKTVIGTMLLSEIVNAAFDRDQLREEDRRFFGIYCDEFQEFATPDFAKLFTQTGKYMVMPTVAHQTRRGQFKPLDPVEGATMAAPNKIYFTLSVPDAIECALEFAKEPPTDTRPEPVLVISQEPVSDLLRGHDNPQIREFTQRYLRPLYELREDARDDMEGERLIRADYLDEAALYRIDERIDWVQQRGRGAERILGRVEESIQRARMQTEKMYSLFARAKDLRQALRETNRLLTALMEGRIECKGEAFCTYLINRVRGATLIPEQLVQILALHISLVYGDPETPRIVPTPLALRYSVWPEEELNRLIDDKHMHKRLNDYREGHEIRAARKAEELAAERERALRELKTWSTWTYGVDWAAKEAFRAALLIYFYPEVARLVAPYLACRFRAPWKDVCPEGKRSFWVKEQHTYGTFIDEIICQFPEQLRASYMSYIVKQNYLNAVEAFLRKYSEGAIVASCLIGSGMCVGSTYASTPVESRAYKTMHMLGVPALAGFEPLQILQFIDRLNEVLVTLNPRFGTDFAKIYQLVHTGYDEDINRLALGQFGLKCQRMQPSMLYTYPKHPLDKGSGEEREDVSLLLKEIAAKQTYWLNRDMCGLWEKLDTLSRTYLIIRACDIVGFGERVAAYTYPQPGIPGASDTAVATLVSALVTALEQATDEKKRGEEEERKTIVDKSVRRELVTLDREKILELLPRRLTNAEIQRLKAACWNELSRCEPAFEMVRVIEAFVAFCHLLAKPENHVRVPSRRFVDKAVNTRTVADMTNEMASVLTGLPKYTAYAKISYETEGRQAVWKGKVQTEKLRALPEIENAGRTRAIRAAIERASSKQYLKSRTEIEEEIRRRQERWRRYVAVEPPPRSKQPESSAPPPASATREPDEPPPIHG